MTIARFKGLHLEDRPIGTLKPFPHNARTHTKKQINQIAASIREFGFTNPVLIDQSDVIIAGHGRVEAAKLLGFDTVPTIRIDHLSEAQKRAYVIADNRLALNAGWDPEILAIEFQHLSSIDIDFDLEITGFETAEIDILVDGPKQCATNTDDWVPPLEPTAISRLGNLWLLGEHRLLCGDARDPDHCSRLIGSDKARLMFADPPYNVRIDGNVGGRGTIKHREFAMASGEMIEAQFTHFLKTVFVNAAADPSLGGLKCFPCIKIAFLLLPNHFPDSAAHSAIFGGRRPWPCQVKQRNQPLRSNPSVP